MSGVWGTITDSNWTDNDAKVVCWTLGHFRPGIYKPFVHIMQYIAIHNKFLFIYCLELE